MKYLFKEETTCHYEMSVNPKQVICCHRRTKYRMGSIFPLFMSCRHFALLLLLLLSSSSFNLITCQVDDVCQDEIIASRPVRMIADDADLFIGALLDVHEAGPGGFYGCGNISESGVIAFEALNWIAATINQEHGLINGKKVVESFIPGVKIGVRVYDSCGHQELSKLHLMDMFSVLESGFKNCLHNLSELRIPGVIDVTGVSNDPKVADVSRANFIPILPLTMGSALPPEVMAKILNQVMSDLKWTKVAIVHSHDEHSTHVVKLLGQSSLANGGSSSICFSVVESLPDPKQKVVPVKTEDPFLKVYEKIVSKLSPDTPVFLIGFDESIKEFTQAMIKRSAKSSSFQWVFSSMPEPSLLKAFGSDLNNQRIYGLAPFPGKFAKFEEHWMALQAPAPGPILGSWFDEYICHVKGSEQCTRSMQMDRSLSESDGDVLWRTYQVMPIIHSIFTFSHAIRNAWIDQCQGMRGLCDALKMMSRQFFIQHYLEPLQSSEQTNSLAGGDSLPPRGRKNDAKSPSPTENIGKLNWKLALTSFTSLAGDLKFQQHILYDSLSNEAQILGKGFNVKASFCPKDGCTDCVKIRQSRIGDEILYNTDSNIDSLSISSPNIEQGPPSQCVSQCSSCWKEVVQGKSQSKSEVTSSANVQPSSNLPAMSSNFRRTWGIITSVSSGIGVLCVLICAIYFLMVFPVKVGTTILGYMILFGLLVIFSVNFLFVFPPNITICWLRKIGMSLGYCTILSGMLVKVMNTWRRMTYKSKRAEDVKLTSPCNLFMIAAGLVTVHLIVTVVWLILLPPKPGYYNQTWKCYPSTMSSSMFLDTESLVSLLYIILLIVMALFFCLMTWKCYDNNREPRYILYCCSSISVIWIIWSFSVYKLKKKENADTSRDVTIICANLASASLVMILLYIRKLYWYSRLRRRDRLIKERLQQSAFPANFYGALHSRGSYGNAPYLWDQMSYASNGGGSTVASSVHGSISSLNQANGQIMANGAASGKSKFMAGFKGDKKKKKSSENVIRAPFEEDQLDDGTMSCASASSSVQVQGTDLYPMEVYDGGSQFQPSSLYASNIGTGPHNIYANEEDEI